MDAGHSHDHAGRVDDALRDSAAGIRAVKISLVVLGITAAAQSVIVAVSRVAMFSGSVLVAVAVAVALTSRSRP